MGANRNEAYQYCNHVKKSIFVCISLMYFSLCRKKIGPKWKCCLVESNKRNYKRVFLGCAQAHETPTASVNNARLLLL